MTVAAGRRSAVSGVLLRSAVSGVLRVLLRSAVSGVLRMLLLLLLLAVSGVLRWLPVPGLGRLSVAAGRTTLHQNFTDEPQPQLPVVFGLLNLNPEPWTPST